ncbi:hypothetical protein Tco_1456582 [Tanacetum coccineum]
MDLKWQMEMLTIRARVSKMIGSYQAEEGPTNFVLMTYTSLGSSSFSNSDTQSQFNVGAYKAGLELVEARLDVYKKNEAIFEEDIKILKLDILLRDNALTELRKKFEKAEKERDDLKLTLKKFENSSENLSKLSDINFQIFKPTAVVSDNKGNKANAVKALACWVWIPKLKVLDHGNLQLELQEKGVIDSGCSTHMTGNMSYLSDYEEIDGGYVAFGGDPKGGKITSKGKIRT